MAGWDFGLWIPRTKFSLRAATVSRRIPRRGANHRTHARTSGGQTHHEHDGQGHPEEKENKMIHDDEKR
jgi:hypothetical protein